MKILGEELQIRFELKSDNTFTAVAYENGEKKDEDSKSGTWKVEGDDIVLMGKDEDGKPFYANHELVRLAIPRRTYTQSHIDYVIEVMESIKHKSHKIKGLKIIYQSRTLRHFTAKLERV